MKRALIIFICLTALAASACKRVPFYAPEEAEIIISTDKTYLRTGGEKSIITVLGFSANGEALHDHTQVLFYCTLGSITPGEIVLMNGRGSVEFISGDRSGIAQIQARSGSVVAEPNPLEIAIGSAALSTLSAAANPARLPPGGGRSRIRVFAFDADGNLLADIPVILTANAGEFLADRGIYLTDNQGMVEDWLDTSRTATVRAESGEQSAEIEIVVEEEAENQLPTANFTYSPTSPQKGETVYFNGSLSTDPDGTIRRYQWDFGDGQGDYGVQVSHRYNWPEGPSKTYTVVLKVTDNQGASATVSRDITVTE